MRAQIEHRPSFIAALGLIIGLSTSYWWPAFACALGLLFVLKSLRTRWILAVSFFVGVVLWPGLPHEEFQRVRGIEGDFSVTSMPRISQVGLIAEINNVTGRYRFISKDTEICLGDVIHIRGQVKGISEVQEPYFTTKGLLGSISVSSSKDIQILHKGPAIFRYGMAWRKSFLGFTERSLTPETAQLVDALCFNVDGDLPDDLRENLQRTGTIHIISASGLHVFLFSLAIQFLLAFLPMPRWMQFVLLIVVLFLYAAAAGFRPPVVRAAFMGIAYMGSEFVKRVPDALSSLSLVAIGYLLWKPLTLLDIGFQLSFLAVFALSYFRLYEKPNISNLPNLLRVKFGHTIWQSAVATFATAPLVAYHFGMVSVVAVVANLLIAAAILPVMVGSVAAWVFGFAFPAVAAGILAVFVTPFLGWISGVVHYLGSFSFAAAEVPDFNAVWLVPIYLIPLILWRPRVRQA